MKIKPEHYWLAIFAICFFAFQLVQDNIRPNYVGNNLTIQYLLGIAPNFFPSVGIPALFVVFIPIFDKKNKSSKWLDENKHLAANMISLIGLLSWEFLQLATTNGRFDWNDVIWTINGSIIFYLIWVLTPVKWKIKKKDINNAATRNG